MTKPPLLLPASQQLVAQLELYLLSKPMREVEHLVTWLREAVQFATENPISPEDFQRLLGPQAATPPTLPNGANGAATD